MTQKNAYVFDTNQLKVTHQYNFTDLEPNTTIAFSARYSLGDVTVAFDLGTEI